MIRLVRSVPEIKQAIDSAAVVRQIKVQLAPEIDEQLLDEVVRTATVVEFKTNDTLIEEGARDDSVYLIRRGSVTVSVRVGGGKEIVIAYVPAGNYVGEMAMLMKRAAQCDGQGRRAPPRRSASTAPRSARCSIATRSCAGKSRRSPATPGAARTGRNWEAGPAA